uniref:Post-GPI attachment to proteins factor 2 n=1 Tax=Steinernema glaseri TaxID=37863 RepID=A0A1I8AJ20_9BILA
MSTKELFRFSPSTIFCIGFIPPLVGALASISLALLTDSEKISNYNWICGKAFLPSLSRIINLPVERTLWQLFTCFHVPMRLVEIGVGYNRYKRLRSVECKHNLLYEVSRQCYLTCGLLELVFLVALSTVVERENGRIHVICFYVFGCFGIGFFLSNVMCHSNSLYYLNPYGRLSYYLKIVFTSIYAILVPVLVFSFFLYWKRCITIAYDIFALCEYVDVFLNIAYHGCAFLDIRYKVVFAVTMEK